MKSRLGIYPGTFDPVHSGHIAFALQAMERAKLDAVWFLPERRPRHKEGVEHFAHRVAMLRRAVQPHPSFEVLELEDINFTVHRTLPKLRSRFQGSQLVFLLGSDVVSKLPEWPDAERLLEHAELVVGCRADTDPAHTEQEIAQWPIRPRDLFVLESYAPEVSSRKVREALQRRQPEKGVLTSVERYSDQNWLYVSLA